MKGLRARIDYLLKHYLIIQNVYKITMSTVFRIIGFILPINNKMILFNAHGRKYNDSPKAIYLKMIEDKRFEGYEFVWALDGPENYDIPGCKKVQMDTFAYFITALKSKYWISCVNIERGLSFKKKNTIYLNTWHGTPLKYVGNAVKGRNDFDFSNIDLFCSAGQFEKDIYIKDFKVSEKAIINTGLPRNDYLYNYNLKQVNVIKNKLGLPLDKKIILYAPTWRDSTDVGRSYSIKPPIDFKCWKEKLGDEWIVLIRVHAYTNKILGLKFNDFIRDFSSYPEINELMIVSDLLISDYSAIIFDYSILEKPIFCFGYDYEQYKKERGLYIELEKELPNGVTKTETELIDKILRMNYSRESLNTKKFKEKYLNYGGNATNLCIENIINK
ncbi:CDP-glycerol glycerophosphotransferase family protein [Alkalibacter rhizosphaerae]|uniref:CDP-glycerol glycerophosphotransferase family protein n=1 Tax=Alkalibacter rhizosphaerae TaxID=2815577 RepID=A0A975AJ25_9FIRM|nr:CDP-glycerol glycerophosphotransferase family protein [Alkalibacter rhizosphaerae]QSX09279.1 CDP-glycerol glycerophosphotransferase family protein [Alkalibacter rhizosphaerae]